MRSVSVVIPAYNEESRLPATLDTVLAYLSEKSYGFVEIVVVNDGSRDGTAGVVKEYAAKHPRVRLLENPGNKGKGYAVRHGMQQARGDWVLFTDADLSAPIEELGKLEDAIGEADADGAIGSRALDRSLIGKRQGILREMSGRVFNLFVRLVTGLPYRDTQCGFKMFRRDVAQAVSARQLSEGFGFDVEILFIAKQLGYRVVEVPVRWFNAEGTKVSLWNGIAAFADPVRVRSNWLKGRYK